jgi:hypothetical protein
LIGLAALLTHLLTDSLSADTSAAPGIDEAGECIALAGVATPDRVLQIINVRDANLSLCAAASHSLWHSCSLVTASCYLQLCGVQHAPFVATAARQSACHLDRSSIRSTGSARKL